ncbi:hypothetical protein CW745_11120 [Psychromonas sp. psych-6C06]|uniref:glycosyl hydrolase family 18 protein n=1 Tax=Psychromonas sp. psych-6C06 TaxID=2058089 RepID=UPI000C3387C3|nr:glycosyl hydrolase family 18 protein [Psychromonas sp. psych-6C06]PKF61178.1 hypothetical protein CW745_11120 [Psychromonas sp. psych-6C06]
MKLNKIVSSMILCSAIALPSIFTPAIADVADSDFKNVGYMPTYRGYLMDKIEFSKLTHVMYSFARPDAQGNIYFYGSGSASQLASLVAKSATAKVGVALGGWDDNYSTARIFENLTANPTTRTNLVNNIVQFAKTHNIDGIDMDWEHPTASSANNYTLFMTELADALHAEGLFLSAAVISYGPMGAHVQDAVLDKLDFVNLMAYDAQGHPDGHHSSMQVAIESVAYWKGRGIDPKKIVLGTPFYSRGAAVETYAQIIASSPDNACLDNANGRMYNGIPTTRAKTQYAIDNVGGIMNWELGQDSFTQYSLLSAIDDVINQVPDYICDTGNPEVTPTPTPTVTSTPTPVITPTPIVSITPTPVVGDITVFIPGQTVAKNGDIVSYQGSCYQAKNNPGTWEVPTASSWFWNSAQCSTIPTPTPVITVTPSLTPTPIVTATPTPVVTATPTPIVTSTPVVTPTPLPEITETTWDKNSVYNNGDEVLVNGVVYTARWWTKGENPVDSTQWGVWKKQ